MRSVAVAFVFAMMAGACYAQLMGGMRPVNANDNEMNLRVQNAAQFAVEEIQSRCNCLDKFQLADVIYARTQVVAGVNYHMDIVLTRNGQPEVHHVTVYDRFGRMALTRDEMQRSN